MAISTLYKQSYLCPYARSKTVRSVQLPSTANLANIPSFYSWLNVSHNVTLGSINLVIHVFYNAHRSHTQYLPAMNANNANPHVLHATPKLNACPASKVFIYRIHPAYLNAPPNSFLPILHRVNVKNVPTPACNAKSATPHSIRQTHHLKSYAFHAGWATS